MSPHKGPLLGATRTRLLASYLVLLLFSTTVSVLATRQLLISRTDERIDSSLTQEVEEFERLVQLGRDPRTGKPFGGDVSAVLDLFFSRNVPGEGETFFGLLDGRPYRSTTMDEEVAARLVVRYDELAGGATAERFTVESGETERRLIAVPVRAGGRARGLFAVSSDASQERSEVDDAVQVAGGVSLGVLLLTSALAFLITSRVLAPLRGLDRTARSITESDLTKRIEVEGNDEMAELARTFNAMLDRLEVAFASQKDFISDAGHELRTPITIIRGHLELMGGDEQERRETLELVTDELDRMSRFVDDLLLLAKARQPDFLRLEPLDLDAVADEVFAKVRALAPRDWRLDAGAALGRVVADRQRLTQAMMNLAVNATRHTDPDEWIELGFALRGDEARLWVADRGPGVPLADRERIFERFEQAGSVRRRAEGTGLGLPLVRAIAAAHGGRVELESAEGIGSRFTIVIPTDGAVT